MALQAKHEVSLRGPTTPAAQAALTNGEDDGQDTHTLWLLLAPSATLDWGKKKDRVRRLRSEDRSHPDRLPDTVSLSSCSGKPRDAVEVCASHVDLISGRAVLRCPQRIPRDAKRAQILPPDRPSAQRASEQRSLLPSLLT